MQIKKYLTVKNIIISGLIFVSGMLFLAGVNTFFAYTNEMEFCTSCHSMQVNLEEYQETIHYKNRTGVQAICSDCHVPKEFFPKLKAKIFAVKDVYHEIVGTIDTPEKYEDHRWDMANRVWAKMIANDSKQCRSCHDYENMDLSAQVRMASRKHSRAPMKGQTCIECHKGIAHIEPDDPSLGLGNEEDDEEGEEDNADNSD